MTYYYAHLEERGICDYVQGFDYTIDHENMILLDSNDQTVVGKWYNRETQQFEVATFDKLAYYSTDDINVGETDECLTAALNAKMGKGAVTNPITSTANDTVAKWVELGTGIFNFTQLNCLVNQPNQWGIVFSIVNSGDVFQIWKSLKSGVLAYRSGNSTGWGESWTACASVADLDTKMNKSGGAFTGEVNFGSNSAKDVLSVEFKPSSTANHGGFIDFHFNGSTADYTARIIESSEGKLNAIADNGFQVSCGTGSVLLGNNIIRLGGQQVLFNSTTMITAGTGNLPLNLVGKDNIYSNHTIQVSSDLRLKENFKAVNVQQAVNFIQALNVMEFNYKGSQEKKLGLIAQQVQLADPELSERFVKTNPNDGMLSVNYTDLINPVIVVIQALMNEVVTLREMVQSQQAK